MKLNHNKKSVKISLNLFALYAGGKDPATLKAIQDEVLKEFYDYTGCESLWG